jgi:hypothetical protein
VSNRTRLLWLVAALPVLVAPSAVAAPPSRPSVVGDMLVAHVHRSAPVQAKDGCGFTQDDPAQEYGSAVGSQDYESMFDLYDQMVADDFVCDRSVKHLQRIVIGGTYFAGVGPASAVHVVIRANDPSGDIDEPSDGEPVCAFVDWGVERIGSADFVIRPSQFPCHLKAGRPYWLEVQVRMDFDRFGSWGWRVTAEHFGADPDWRNPGGAFATGCTTYSGASEGGERTAGDCIGAGTVPPNSGLVFAVD